MTNNELIKKALQELGIVAFNGTATASQAQDCLDGLNSMMAEWEQDDLNFNWFPQDTLSATCPIPRWAESGIISNLALYVSASFRSPLTESLVGKAQKGLSTITRKVMTQKMAPADMSYLTTGTRYNIETDS
jgi:hypothetical protein